MKASHILSKKERKKAYKKIAIVWAKMKMDEGVYNTQEIIGLIHYTFGITLTEEDIKK